MQQDDDGAVGRAGIDIADIEEPGVDLLEGGEAGGARWGCRRLGGAGLIGPSCVAARAAAALASRRRRFWSTGSAEREGCIVILRGLLAGIV
jgi:hypothetical protein